MRNLNTIVSDRKVNPELMNYLEEVILPQYDVLDKSHGIEHILNVVETSLLIKDTMLIDYDAELDDNVVVTAAVYHDLGLTMGNIENHHTMSADLLMTDGILDKFFMPIDIFYMMTACSEHRASYTGKYSNTYSRILADADTASSGYSIDKLIKYRTADNFESNNPSCVPEDIFDKVYNHLVEKYGNEGYSRLSLEASHDLFDSKIQELKTLLLDKSKVSERYITLIRNYTIVQLSTYFRCI